MQRLVASTLPVTIAFLSFAVYAIAVLTLEQGQHTKFSLEEEGPFPAALSHRLFGTEPNGLMALGLERSFAKAQNGGVSLDQTLNELAAGGATAAGEAVLTRDGTGVGGIIMAEAAFSLSGLSGQALAMFFLALSGLSAAAFIIRYPDQRMSAVPTVLLALRELGFTRVTGLDFSEDAIRFCREKGFRDLSRGDACALPFADASFDLVLATDIIEHVDDDLGALGEIRRLLRPGGIVLLSVPAFDQLWGLQDRLSHHRRRYRLAPLKSKFERAGLRLSRAFYFNYLMFLPIWIVRRLIDRLHIEIESETRLVSPLVNRVCNAIFRADVGTAPLLRPPFGVSILVVAGR